MTRERPDIDEALLRVQDCGRIDYAGGLSEQRRLQRQVIEGRAVSGGPGPMWLLLLEHEPPVITVSRRPDAHRHLVADQTRLDRAGVTVTETDRGGDITYHGPGQLVVYPILDLNRLGLRVHSYMRFLEGIVIEGLGRFGVAGHRDAEATGVWVGGVGGSDGATKRRSDEGAARAEEPGEANEARKICAMGVRVSRWVSMHGLALNVTTNLEHFDLIVPCGLTGRSVTSLERELGPRCPSMDEVKEEMTRRFARSIRQRATEPRSR